jgi:hypothetical protein
MARIANVTFEAWMTDVAPGCGRRQGGRIDGGKGRLVALENFLQPAIQVLCGAVSSESASRILHWKGAQLQLPNGLAACRHKMPVLQSCNANANSKDVQCFSCDREMSC